MSNVLPFPTTKPQVIDEAYFEQFTNDQLVYKAASCCDLAQDVLFDEEECQDALGDARFSVLEAYLALKVLCRRILGEPYSSIKAQVDAALIARLQASLEASEGDT
ncbi:hypothetical protein D9M71_793290 [compost metagenome]